MKKLVLISAIVMVLGMVSNTFPQVCPSGIISYWKFDEGSGVIAGDSRSLNDGILYGANWSAGKVGGALSFDGVDDYVRIPDSESIRLSGVFTIEVWAKVNSIDGPEERSIIGKGRAFQENYVLSFYSGWGPNLRFLIRHSDGTYSEVFAPYTLGIWHHIAAVYDGRYLRLYIDGNEATAPNDIGSQTLLRDPTFLGIGSRPNENSDPSQFLNGLIDELAIYNLALTPEEIQQHYQNGLNGLGYCPVPSFYSLGFQPPVDNPAIAIKVKKNRVIPLKAQLFDASTSPVTNLSSPPVIEVWYSSETEPAVEVSDQALSAGQGTEGNQFVFSDGKWQFNLLTKKYTASGTYTVKMVPGGNGYTIDPTPTATFVIE
jgi:hypothetical protein